MEKRFIQLFEAFEKIEGGVGKLLLGSLDLFKLLFFNDNDPLSLDMDEATAQDILVDFYENTDAGGRLKFAANPNCRVFFEPFTDMVESGAKAQLRIYPVQVSPENVYLAEMFVQVDIIAPVKLSKIKGGRRRNKIAAEVVGCLNGKEIGLIGPLKLYERPIVLRQFKNDYWGYSLLFQTGVAGRGR